MVGIGLGAFLGGIDKGIGIGRRAREAFDEGKTRRALGAIDKDAKRNFDMDVERGIRQEGDWDRFYSEYAVPKKTRALMEAGDIEGAEKWRSWADGDAARRGGKLFANGMVKAQTGDVKGALTDFIQAGRVKGYGADFDIGDVEEVKGKDGATGYRVMIKDAEGNEYPQTFDDPTKLMQFGATFLNPESAFDSYMGQVSAAQKFKTEVAADKAKRTNETEALADRKRLGLGAKSTDYATLRKQAIEELDGADAGFANLGEDEREAKIAGMIDRYQNNGAPAGPGIAPQGPMVTFDPVTGEITEAPRGNRATKGDRLY